MKPIVDITKADTLFINLLYIKIHYNMYIAVTDQGSEIDVASCIWREEAQPGQECRVSWIKISQSTQNTA